MNRPRLIQALVFFNLAVFVLTVAFLPRAGRVLWPSYHSFSQFFHTLYYFFSSFVNSRTHWEIAWLVLLASSLASIGVYLLLTQDSSKSDE